MKIKCFLLSLFTILSLYSVADNKVNVTSLYTTPNHQDVALPLMLDKTNINGEEFSNTKLLETFLSFPKASDFTELIQADIYDSFHLSKAINNSRFYFLTFQFSSTKFSKTNLRITAPSMFEVYINNIKEASKTTIEDTLSNAKTTKLNFSALPSTTYNVVIKYMSLSTNKSPEDITITLEPEDKNDKIDYVFSKLKDKRKITIRDIIEGKRITSSTISQDGNYILLKYTTTKSDGKTYTENELYNVRDNKRLSLSPTIKYSWMPHSSKLYYTDNRSDKIQLKTVNPMTLAEEILADDIPDGSFFFTPDEQQLIYRIEEKQKASSSDLTLLAVPESVQPGNKDRSFIGKYTLKTGIFQQLTYGKASTLIEDVSDDSRYVLYSITEYDATKRPFFFNSLYRLDLNSLVVDTLFSKEGFADNAQFSPDEKKILIQGSAEAFDGIGNNLPTGEIPNPYNKIAFVMDLQTKQIEPILKDFTPSIDRIYWNKIDNLIYLKTTDKDYVNIYTYNYTTKKSNLLSLDEDVISTLDLSYNSAKATYIGMSNSNFTKAYILDLKNEKSTIIADPDKSIVDQLNMNKVEDWSFVSTDGNQIDGRYYLPPNFDKTKKYPLIVYYYGGTVPTSRTLSSPYPAQVYAALGYVVYVLQPSGAIGYGSEFAARHVNGWGKQNAEDIIEGTKLFVKAHDFINDKKIGCIGASYGGYMTMYLQTQTDLFAAAVSHAGISSIASYWGEGYWGYTYSSGASAGSYPWNNPDLYVKKSPLFNAEKINTPILLLHGTVDTNVPIGESMQMYTALKILGKPVEFIQVKGENHGIRDYKKRIEWNNSIYAWFAKWLQDDSSWWNSLYK